MNRFHCEIQYVPESITLLNIISQPAPFISEYMNRIAAKYGVDPDRQMNDVVDLLQEIEDAARAEFAKDMEDIRFFCGNQKENERIESFANIMMLAQGNHPKVQPVSEFIAGLNRMSDDEYTAVFYKGVKEYGSMTVEDLDDEKPTALDVFERIHQMDASDGEKLHLQKLFIHHKDYINKFAQLMERSADVLKKYEKKLMALGNKLADSYERILGDTSMAKYIMQEFYQNPPIPGNLEDCEIYVSYMKCVAMGCLFEGDDIKNVKANVSLGVIFCSSIKISDLMKKRATLDEEKVLAMLKLLADKSKFEILSATVDAPAYGAQLASMLGLTTATISHHTSALLDQNLLTLDKVDTKIYYRANPDMIRSLVKYLQDNLLRD